MKNYTYHCWSLVCRILNYIYFIKISSVNEIRNLIFFLNQV